MRILFAAMAVPYPPTHGQRLRNWALLQAFRQAGHEVTAICFATPPEAEQCRGALETMCETVRFVPMPAGGLRAYATRLRALPSRFPQGVLKYDSPPMRAAIAAVLQDESPDVAVCDDLYNIRNFPEPCPIPLVLNKHDLLGVILRRYAAHSRNPAVAAYACIEYWKVRRWEAEAVRRADAVMCCSPVDAELMAREAPEQNFTVVPNSIDVETYRPQPDPGGQTLLYCGSVGWHPNRDAVQFFLRRIFPLVRERVPQARLLVTGPAPDAAFVRRHGADGAVEFTGFVPDIRAVLARATVSIVPLRIGSGTRLKILEAAAMGRPVVSTRIGAEGLSFEHGREILLADEPAAFAEAVCGLLANGRRRVEIGAAARRKVVEDYSVEALRAQLQKVWGGLGSARAAAQGAGAR